MKAVVEIVHVGMTENELKGVAMSVIYQEGGEGEAYPFWILTGCCKNSNQAISRCRNKVIEPGDMIQSARLVPDMKKSRICIYYGQSHCYG